MLVTTAKACVDLSITLGRKDSYTASTTAVCISDSRAKIAMRPPSRMPQRSLRRSRRSRNWITGEGRKSNGKGKSARKRQRGEGKGSEGKGKGGEKRNEGREEEGGREEMRRGERNQHPACKSG